jgi:hypothetical protein
VTAHAQKPDFVFRAKRTSPFISAGASVQSTTGSRGVRISGSNAGYIVFRGSVKSSGYPLHSPVSPSLPLLCVTVCHHISTGLYKLFHNISCISVYLSQYLTNLMHKFLLYNKFIICLYKFRAQEVKLVLYSIWYRHTYRWPSGAQVGRGLHSVGGRPVHRLGEDYTL